MHLLDDLEYLLQWRNQPTSSEMGRQESFIRTTPSAQSMGRLFTVFVHRVADKAIENNYNDYKNKLASVTSILRTTYLVGQSRSDQTGSLAQRVFMQVILSGATRGIWEHRVFLKEVALIVLEPWVAIAHRDATPYGARFFPPIGRCGEDISLSAAYDWILLGRDLPDPEALRVCGLQYGYSYVRRMYSEHVNWSIKQQQYPPDYSLLQAAAQAGNYCLTGALLGQKASPQYAPVFGQFNPQYLRTLPLVLCQVPIELDGRVSTHIHIHHETVAFLTALHSHSDRVASLLFHSLQTVYEDICEPPTFISLYALSLAAENGCNSVLRTLMGQFYPRGLDGAPSILASRIGLLLYSAMKAPTAEPLSLILPICTEYQRLSAAAGLDFSLPDMSQLEERCPIISTDSIIAMHGAFPPIQAIHVAAAMGRHEQLRMLLAADLAMLAPNRDLVTTRDAAAEHCIVSEFSSYLPKKLRRVGFTPIEYACLRLCGQEAARSTFRVLFNMGYVTNYRAATVTASRFGWTDMTLFILACDCDGFASALRAAVEGGQISTIQTLIRGSCGELDLRPEIEAAVNELQIEPLRLMAQYCDLTYDEKARIRSGLHAVLEERIKRNEFWSQLVVEHEINTLFPELDALPPPCEVCKQC